HQHRAVRYVWLAIIVVSIVPVAAASLLLNPLVFLALGPEAWRERVARVHPYRWWVAASLVALAMATTVYATRFA
ncbi:MAG: hypothetical protein ACRDLR_06050, partial [Gaiellaceae bacterium]